MERPELRVAGGVYLLLWEQEHLSIRIDRIIEDSHHLVSGEVTIRSVIPNRHLHQARLNLTSTIARKTLVRAMEEIWSGHDWPSAIEYAAVLVLEKYREGEPAKRVEDIPKREGLTYRIHPFILERQPNLLFGPGGIAKSFLGQWWSVLVDTGAQTPLACEPGKVLYLDYETDEDDFVNRIEKIQAGMDEEGRFLASNVYYRFCAQPLAHDIAAIERICAEIGVNFLVVDSAGPACGGDLEDPRSVLRYFSALRALKLTSLTIGHTQKNADVKTPLGSTYWINAPRRIWQAKGSQEEGDHESTIVLSDFKRNSTERVAPAAFRFKFEQDCIRIERADTRGIPEALDAMGLRERIKVVLTDGARDSKEIAEALHEKEDVVRMTLNRGREKGVFRRLAGYKWGLSS